MSLINQPFVKNDKITVQQVREARLVVRRQLVIHFPMLIVTVILSSSSEQYCKDTNTEIKSYALFIVGEVRFGHLKAAYEPFHRLTVHPLTTSASQPAGPGEEGGHLRGRGAGGTGEDRRRKSRRVIVDVRTKNHSLSCNEVIVKVACNVSRHFPHHILKRSPFYQTMD